MREHRYASWRTALGAVAGIYLITDTRDGRQYVGKADGAESIRQRWGAYATNGHGGSSKAGQLLEWLEFRPLVWDCYSNLKCIYFPGP